MVGFTSHLLSVLMMYVLAFGTVGLRALHIASESAACCEKVCGHSDPARDGDRPTPPQHDPDCQTCKALDALTGTVPTDDASAHCVGLAFIDLVDVHSQRPAFSQSPRVAGARPPPNCR
ncbi:MAG: hypothetical protein JNK53_02775 [Phycisphaerae bacterium]|nr:hypothetical protein [Phycisphaerae bacterium]